MPKMDQTADAADVSNCVRKILKNAMNKNVARKKRLNDTHHPALRCSFQAQSRMKNIQAKSLADVGRRDMLVLGLRSRAVPSYFTILHLEDKCQNLDQCFVDRR